MLGIFWIISFHSIIGQSSYIFHHLETSSGLSNNSVKTVLRDSYGFLWIGTESGLNRYDGYGFKVYTTHSGAPNALISNDIIGLQEDGLRNIWVYLGYTYMVYERENDCFLSDTKQLLLGLGIQSDPSFKVFVDKKRDLWVLNKRKVFFYDVQKKHSFVFNLKTPLNDATTTEVGENGEFLYGIQKSGVGPAGTNPWLIVNGFGFTHYKKDVVETSINLNYKLDKITPGLSAKALVSYDSYYAEQKTFRKQTQAFRLDSGPDEEDSYTVFGEDTKLKYSGGYLGSYSKTYLEGSLNYARNFGNHSVTGLLLGNMEDRIQSGDYIPYRSIGMVTRLTYGYDRRYFGELNLGYNGSQNFARGKRFGLFPSLSAGWVISGEDFFSNLTEVVSFLKVRASYGMVGNDKIGGSRFMYTEEYSTRNGWSAPSVPSFGLTGSSVDIITLSRIANPNLTWEKANKFNFGFESNLFNGHLSTTFDAFLEYRRDILMDRNSIPLYLGVTPSSANIGETKNTGMELELKYRNKIGKDFEYWTNVNYSYAKNTILSKDEPANKIPWQKEEGHSIGQFQGYQVLGFFDVTDFNDDGTLKSEFASQLVGEAPQPGDFRYRDVNTDGVVDDRDKLPIGYSDIPEANYGFSYGFNYKGFDFSMMWQGSYNVSLKIGSEILYEFCEGGKVQDFHQGRWAYYTDPFSGELVDTRATATYPRLHSQSSSPNWTTNDFFLYNSSYLKLRNMEIGYTLAIKQLKVLGINQLRIYANTNNLLTLSKVKQVDPEGPGYGSNRERGWNYPQLVIYNMGLSVTF